MSELRLSDRVPDVTSKQIQIERPTSAAEAASQNELLRHG